MLHRLTVRSLLSTITLIVASTVASAQSGPPLEWVVGYPAGGGSDFVARALSEPLARGLERPIVVSNKPGAATSVAAGYVAKSREQGNVIFSADFATLAANPYLYSKLPYDAEKDFTPVGLIARFPMLLVVHPSVPAKDLREFAAWAKTQPDGVHYASAGPGSPHHLATEYLRQRTGLKLVHVAYRGAAPAVNDLLGGQVRMAIMDTATIQQYITSGKVRALGVASKQRLAAFPDLPTLAEQGLTDFEVYA